jgi:hypothetical protein
MSSSWRLKALPSKVLLHLLANYLISIQFAAAFATAAFGLDFPGVGNRLRTPKDAE